MTRLAAFLVCLTLAACAPGGSPPGPPPAAPGASGDLLFLRQRPASAPDPVVAFLVTPDEAASFRGWFAADPELWAASAPLADRVADSAVVAFVQPVGCDTVGSVALEVRDGTYALGLRDVVEHPECLVAHEAVAAFRVSAPGRSFFAAGYAPGGDPAVHVAAPALESGAFEVSDPGVLPADVRETVATRIGPGTRVFAFVGPACAGVRPLLVIEPTRLRVPPCPAGERHLTVYAVPGRLVPEGATL